MQQQVAGGDEVTRGGCRRLRRPGGCRPRALVTAGWAAAASQVGPVTCSMLAQTIRNMPAHFLPQHSARAGPSTSLARR